MEYSIYPFKYIRISQRHDEGNHLAHWKPTANYMDKPWDEAVKDSGKQYFEPQNDYVIVEIIGINPSKYTNSVRLQTCNKVKIPYQDDPVILELTLTHIDEDELKKYKVGQVLKAGGKYLKEGKDGATANHYHCTANIGKYYGLKLNSNDKYVFCYQKSLIPPDAFYVNNSINIINANGYKFKEIPTARLKYRAHVQSDGWTEWKYSGEIAGTTGEQKRLEAIQIDFGDKIVEAKAHIQKDGWVDYGKITKDTIIGTTGEAKRLECLQLKGDFEFQVHIQSYGWSCFTDADGICTLGSVGQQKRIEAIVIKEK